jgi:hypothetical protein
VGGSSILAYDTAEETGQTQTSKNLSQKSFRFICAYTHRYVDYSGHPLLPPQSRRKSTDTHDFPERKAHILINNYAVPGVEQGLELGFWALCDDTFQKKLV